MPRDLFPHLNEDGRVEEANPVAGSRPAKVVPKHALTLEHPASPVTLESITRKVMRSLGHPKLDKKMAFR